MRKETGLPSIEHIEGKIGFSPISFYEICKFVGAWQGNNINQHGKWLESSLANGLCFSEIETMLQHLTLNNLNDDKATFNINQIGQIFIVLKVMAERYKVYMITSYELDIQIEDMRKRNHTGFSQGTPFLTSDGRINYTTNRKTP